MDNCKRPRLELINGTLRRGNATQKSFILSQDLAEDIIDMNNAGVTTSTTTTTTNTTITNSATTTTSGAAAALPGNVYLTICDDNSNESPDEYISIENGCIKREPNLTETAQRHMGVNVGLTSINTQTAAALLPATVQLPSGCEIYLVKEYLNPPPPLTPTNAPRTVISSTTITTKNNNQIKLENTQTNSVVATTTNQVGKSGLQIRRKCNNVQQPVILNNNNNNIIDNNAVMGLIDERTDFEKQSELLEAYKKRDDKRRATHNEVERRRRDKINSWIFKLKEMLPNEIPNYVPIESESCNNNSNSNSSTSDQQGLSNNNNNNNNNNRNCRNLPCDSKSQILIKACEYIKAMQQELKNLRDCLTEQESIRQRNEQLQQELNVLKNVHLAVSVMEEDEDDVIVTHCNNHLSVAASDDAVDGDVDDLTHNLNSNPNSNFNVTLNSLNNLGGDSLFMSTTNTGNASLVAVVDSKRELLMREFVD